MMDAILGKKTMTEGDKKDLAKSGISIQQFYDYKAQKT